MRWSELPPVAAHHTLSQPRNSSWKFSKLQGAESMRQQADVQGHRSSGPDLRHPCHALKYAVTCGGALVAMASLHGCQADAPGRSRVGGAKPITKAAPQKAAAPKPLGWEAALSPQTLLSVRDAKTLASELSRVTKRQTIVVFPEEERLKSAVGTAAKRGAIRWVDLQRVLGNIGAITFTVDGTKTACVVQGRSYAATQSITYCDQEKSKWKLLSQALNELDAARRARLLSKQGLTYDVDLTGCPPSLRKAVESMEEAWKPAEVTRTPSWRARIYVVPGINTAFPEGPAKHNKGWWSWEPQWTETTPRFPKSIVFPTDRSEFKSKVLGLPSGEVSIASLNGELRRVTDWQVRLDLEIHWPTVAVAGGKPAVTDMLDCLRTSSAMSVKRLNAEKVLVLSKPEAVDYVVDTKWMTPKEAQLYQETFNAASRGWNMDLGPIAASDVTPPLAAMPAQWIRPLLLSVGMDDAVGKDPGKSETQKTNEWLSIYKNSNVVFVPRLRLAVEYEQKTVSSPGQPAYWNSGRSGGGEMYEPLCTQ